MHICCLCPTYRRPQHLIENMLAGFLAQDYPDKCLLVLDDGGTLPPVRTAEVAIISTRERYPSLPAKYNEMASWAIEHYGADALAVWEDDDLYLPWYLSQVAQALEERPWSVPAVSWSTYGRRLHRETKIFHAAIALRADTWRACPWPDTKKAGFDHTFRVALEREFGPPADPNAHAPGIPGYVFRWEDTGAWHGEAIMRRADDEAWYDSWAEKAPVVVPVSGPLQPQYDEPARVTMAEIGRTAGVAPEAAAMLAHARLDRWRIEC